MSDQRPRAARYRYEQAVDRAIHAIAAQRLADQTATTGADIMTQPDLLGEVYRRATPPEFVKSGRRYRLTAAERADAFREVAYGLAVARRALRTLAEAEDVELLREFYGRSWALLRRLDDETQKRNRAAD